MALHIEGFMPQPEWPKELESLSTHVAVMLDCAKHSHSSLERLIKNRGHISRHYKETMHQYDKLIDYVKQGYEERMKAGWKDYTINDAVRLWSYHENALTRGIMGRGLRAHLNHSLELSSIKAPEQCYEQYLQPVHKSWNRMRRLQPVSRKNLELLKRFNDITQLVERYEFDKHEEWQFNENKDSWERGRAKGLLIFHY